LGEKSTFFDTTNPNEEEKLDGSKATPGPELQISSFDILIYAYLKEEINNTPDSSEVKYLKAKFPNLIKFVDNFEKIEIKKCEKSA
jgi:hypothetical protein